MSVAAEYSTDPVLELSHATVPAKFLFHAHVNEVAVVVFFCIELLFTIIIILFIYLFILFVFIFVVC